MTPVGCSMLGAVQPDQPTMARRAATGCASVSGHSRPPSVITSQTSGRSLNTRRSRASKSAQQGCRRPWDDQRAQRIEMDAKTGQQTQQGRFHDRRPVRDAFPRAHLDAGLDKAERQMEKQFAPFFRCQGSFDTAVWSVMAEALDDGEARDLRGSRDRKWRQGIAGDAPANRCMGSRRLSPPKRGEPAGPCRWRCRSSGGSVANVRNDCRRGRFRDHPGCHRGLRKRCRCNKLGNGCGNNRGDDRCGQQQMRRKLNYSIQFR